MSKLKITDLEIFIHDRLITGPITLEVNLGETVVLKGANGSGKSSLANALMGRPGYSIRGKAMLEGKNLLALPIHERAKRGLFLAFQNPVAIDGVPLGQLLRLAYNSVHPERSKSVLEFKEFAKNKIQTIGLDESFLERGVNEGASGGEKKRGELLQLLILEPKYAILDESDSGLDAEGVNLLVKIIKKLQASGTGILLITHSRELINKIKPRNIYELDKVPVRI